jgi:hypothetical protein
MTRERDIPSRSAQTQALADLRAMFLSADEGVFGRIVALIPGLPSAAVLQRLLRDGAPLAEGDGAELHPALALAATLPGDDRAAFVVATAALLADRMRNAAAPDDLSWHFDAHAATYRGLPAPARAAIFNGYHMLSRMGRIRLDAEIAPADRQSRAYADVHGALVRLARGLTPQRRRILAHADGAAEAARHEAALDAVLARPDAALPEGAARWYPGEVLDLASLLPRAPGFAEATALVLADHLRRAETGVVTRCTGAEFLWLQVAEAYGALPAPARDAILAGYRHLYETLPRWDPYPGWAPERILREGVVIPRADP